MSVHEFSVSAIPQEALAVNESAAPENNHQVFELDDSSHPLSVGQVILDGLQINGSGTTVPTWTLDRHDYVQTHADRYGSNSLVGEQIKPSKLTEVDFLSKEGWNITTVAVEDPQALPEVTQLRVSKDIAQLERRTRKAMITSTTYQNPNILYNPRMLRTQLPAINQGAGAWGHLRMSAAALHSLYGARDLNTLGEGIDPRTFNESIIQVPDENGIVGTKSAVELLYATSTPDVAEATLDRYTEFSRKPIDASSRELLQGCIDGRSIRTRAVLAMDMVQEHLDVYGLSDRQDLVSVSLACGAAAPVYMMADQVEKNGGKFEKIVLADIDPMALASAYSLADDDRRQTIELHKRNLLRNDLTEYVPEKSADVVDILGLFEYLPEKTATRFLKNVAEIVRPGGVIVLGNMVDDRPEQTFFKDVVQWPSVQQRSVTETLEIIERAGFSKENISVAIPSNEGVYAVVAIHVPSVEQASDES